MTLTCYLRRLINFNLSYYYYPSWIRLYGTLFGGGSCSLGFKFLKLIFFLVQCGRPDWLVATHQFLTHVIIVCVSYSKLIVRDGISWINLF